MIAVHTEDATVITKLALVIRIPRSLTLRRTEGMLGPKQEP